MLERILIPLDGSERAEAILTQARRLLKLHDAEVILLRVVEYAATGKEEALTYLGGVQRRLQGAGARVRTAVREAPVAPAILEAADQERATLIAMTTHGRTGIPRWVFGSVTEKVLRASRIPVLAVRSFPADGRAELPFRNILFPVDGSEPSRQAMKSVVELARPLDARVTLLHVIEETGYATAWSMREAANELAQAGVAAVAETRRGDPANEILNALIDLKIDLVVMPSHGRSGISRWVFGSVTEKVLRGCTVPILVVRARP